MDGQTPDVKVYNTPNKSKKVFLIVFLIIILGLLAVAGAYWFKNSKAGSTTTNAEPTAAEISFPTDTPALSPTPSEAASETTTTPKPTTTSKSTSGLDRSKLNIQVLNGTGVAGVAKKASDYLTGLGYTVKETGNADSFGLDKTVIEVTAANKQYLDQLKKDLSSEYSIGTTSADLSSSSFDAIVTIGSN